MPKSVDKDIFSADRRDLWIGCGIFLLALCMRCWYWYCHPMLTRDGAYYLNQAFRFSDQTALGLRSSPLYVALLSILQTIFGGRTEFCGRLINVILGSALPVIVYFSACRIGIRRMYAILVSLLLVFYVDLVSVSPQILRDTPALFFGYAAMALYLRRLDRCGKRCEFFIGDAFSAMSFLFRYEGILFFVCGLWISLCCGIKEDRGIKKILQRLSMSCLVFSVVSLLVFHLCGWNASTLCIKIFKALPHE